MRPETIKPLEENIGSKFFDFSLGDDFLEWMLKAKATRAKMKKGDDIKLKLLHSKGNHQGHGNATHHVGGNTCKSYI